ncbi:MAG TPA: sigma factor-like helix-turn-helix DNA-binding protein, partial [Tepidisphaeraceae bacterium]|nr:sigma factor-like helix-turn-helix DNA-binding protein [Tepidisphaeraceae bacterium]
MAIVESRRLDQMFEEGAGRRDVGEDGVLFKRARALEEKDRLILELAFKNNLTVRQIGRILEKPAGTISRRMNRICARLRDPMVAALLEPDCGLASQFRRIAIEHFVQGRKVDELARVHQIRSRQVRVMLGF